MTVGVAHLIRTILKRLQCRGLVRKEQTDGSIVQTGKDVLSETGNHSNAGRADEVGQPAVDGLRWLLRSGRSDLLGR